jgi:hypothetical protein
MKSLVSSTFSTFEARTLNDVQHIACEFRVYSVVFSK